ncbi:unnamed protein product [Oreochromis niloticus]|nr:unnamed protein product [Mustela putorius furo]
MSRPMSYLETTTHDSCNIWMTSLTDKYKSRPETPEYEEMSLADFAALCRLVSGPNEGKDVLPLLNQLGFVQRRKNDKPAIIRYYHCSQEKDPEQYYGRLLRLYLPHRSEQELKPQGFQTYQSFYNSGCVRLPCSDHSESVKRVVKRNKDKYEKNSEDIESALEEFEQNRDVVIDEWCNLAPESEVVRLQCDENLPERHSDDENEQENVPDYSRQSDAVTEIRAIREQPAVDPAVVVRSENDGQIIKLGLRMDNRQPMRHNRSANAASDDLVYIERAEESLKFKGADLDEKKIYANPEVTAALQTMRQASVEEMMPLLQLRETASRPDTLTLIHHNTEGLPSHISDIKSHHEMCLADVLCLTESHLQGSFVADSLRLDGYTMFKRNRHVSYSNFPHMASRSGGGVVVYLRNHFQVQVKQYLHNVTDLEFLVLKVQAPFPALIAVVYRPPDYSLTPFMQNLKGHAATADRPVFANAEVNRGSGKAKAGA